MSLRDHLQAIYNERGRLTPDDIVNQARDEAHPLHSRFEWDDSVAGEAWRKVQAHELIRSVRIVYAQDERGRPLSVRGFHAIRTEDGHVYEPAEKVAADPFQARLLMADMEREWKQLKRRYEEFAEFWAMVKGETDEAIAA